MEAKEIDNIIFVFDRKKAPILPPRPPIFIFIFFYHTGGCKNDSLQVWYGMYDGWPPGNFYILLVLARDVPLGMGWDGHGLVFIFLSY